MTLPTLAPPSPATPPAGAPPELPRRALFRRTGLATRPPLPPRLVLASLTLHVGVVVLLVWVLSLQPPRVAVAPAGGEGDRVEYMDLAYPAPGGGAAAARADVAAPDAGFGSRVDTVAGATPALVPPSAVPRGIPAPSAQPGGAGGVGAPGGAGSGAAGVGGGGQGGVGWRGPLGGGYADKRLALPPPTVPPPPPLSDEERYQRHLAARLRALNDSIYGEQERARKATDWTVKDKSGNRWGISPDGIHLGPVKLPPIQLGTRSPENLAAPTPEQQRAAIGRQAEGYDYDQALKESTERTRARKDAERKKKQEEQKTP